MKINRKEIAFMAGYILWVFCNSFLVTIGGQLYNVLKVLAITLFTVAIFFNRWKKQEIIRYIAFTLLCLIVYLNNRESDFLILALLLLASKDQDIYRIAHLDLPIRVVGISSTLICYFLHIVSGNDLVSKSSFLGHRYALGYYHPNNLFAQVFLVCIGILLTYHKRLKFKNYIELIIFECIFGILTYSRTGMMLLGLLILMIAIFSDKIEKHHVVSFVIQNAFILCFLFTMGGVLLFNVGNGIISKIDAVISGRFTYASRFIAQYGTSLWGQNIEYISTLGMKTTGMMASVLDNLYAYLWVTSGSIFTLIFLYLATKQQKILLNNHEIILATIILCYALYSITEKVYFSVNNNYTLLLLTLALKSGERGTWLSDNKSDKMREANGY